MVLHRNWDALFSFKHISESLLFPSKRLTRFILVDSLWLANLLITTGNPSSYHLTFGNIFSCSCIEIFSICFDNVLLIVYAVPLPNVGDHGTSQFSVLYITQYSFSFLISLLCSANPLHKLIRQRLCTVFLYSTWLQYILWGSNCPRHLSSLYALDISPFSLRFHCCSRVLSLVFSTCYF